MTDALRFQLDAANWCLEFSPAATGVMLSRAQMSPKSRESVGQLYTRDLTQTTVCVELATWLAPKIASWGRVQFDPKKALAERRVMFDQGFHCVGVWHTHPEANPSPSGEDKTLARDYANSANAQLSGIVFVIVGTLSYPSGFNVWVDDGNDLLVAHPVANSGIA